MGKKLLFLIWCVGVVYGSEMPPQVHLPEQEWNECKQFIQTEGERFFSQGTNYISPGEGHPYVIQHDPRTGRTYIHLNERKDAVIGIGGFKRVTQSLLYGEHPELVAHCQGWKSLAREAEVLSKLENSPGIVHMQSFLSAPDGGDSIILEYYDAGSLATPKGKAPKFSGKKLVSFFGELMTGLKNLHAAGYIHRDLHRGNVLFRHAQGKLHAALTDFGLALRMDEEPHAKVSVQITALAPEVLLKGNGAVDRKRAETYSFGVLLYYMIFQKRPSWCEEVRLCRSKGNAAANRRKAHRGILQQYAKTLARTRSLSGIKKDLALLVMRILNPNPHKRIYLDVAIRQLNAIAKHRGFAAPTAGSSSV